MADIARHPAFAAERRRAGQGPAPGRHHAAAGIADRASPSARCVRWSTARTHPYGSVGVGRQGERGRGADPGRSRQAVHDTWLRPDLARITVVGDITMDQLLPLLEQRFGNWQTRRRPAPHKDLDVAIPRGQAADRRDRPAQFAAIDDRCLAHVLPVDGTAPQHGIARSRQPGDRRRLPLAAQSGPARGQGLDLLRLFLSSARTRARSWSRPTARCRPTRPADSIKAMIADMAAFPGKRGVDATELQRVTDGNIRGLPNSFQTNSQVLAGSSTTRTRPARRLLRPTAEDLPRDRRQGDRFSRGELPAAERHDDRRGRRPQQDRRPAQGPRHPDRVPRGERVLTVPRWPARVFSRSSSAARRRSPGRRIAA